MYHLLVSYNGWSQTSDSIHLSRALEFTEDQVKDIYRPSGSFDVARIAQIPALFASEIEGSGQQTARLGFINHVASHGTDLRLRYSFDDNFPPIPNSTLAHLASHLGIESLELYRTHWSIKDIDLFRVLFEHRLGGVVSPTLFSIDAAYSVEEDLLAVMMPFAGGFQDVYAAIREMARSKNLRCLRADDIWEHDAIIQDVVSLICRSQIVVCDCTSRNPNVFYETGIAHALGKKVVLITQRGDDIPFDLRHLRYLEYLNNNEGRAELVSRLAERVETILDSNDKRA